MDFREEFNKWMMSETVDDLTKNELRILDEREIEDRFYTDLEFGTGGLRGRMAAGTNRMNIYTVRKATQGIANEILSYAGGKKALLSLMTQEIIQRFLLMNVQKYYVQMESKHIYLMNCARRQNSLLR